MTDDTNEKNSKKEKDEKSRHPDFRPDRTSEPVQNTVDTDFMKEKIKSRPINRKRLLRRTLITSAMAVLFGGIACVVFLALEPLISRYMNPEPEPAVVTFPEEPQADEMNPADMVEDDSEFASNAASEAAVAAASAAAVVVSENQDTVNEQITSGIDEVLSDPDRQMTQYESEYAMLKEIADEASYAIVTVAGITQSTDVFNDPYETGGSASGVIIADNGQQLLVLVPYNTLRNAESIEVTFPAADLPAVNAEIVAVDYLTGIAVIGIAHADLPANDNHAVYTIASLGSSSATDLTGVPVIAIGSPAGTPGSMMHGTVTADDVPTELADADYRRMTTDMNGSSASTGALISLRGQVLGIISPAASSGNVLTATGISGIKPLIARLSNGKEKAYAGIFGADVTEAIAAEQEMPTGCYVRRTAMNSPAMQAGVRSGDVITAWDDDPVAGWNDLAGRIGAADPEDEIELTLARSDGTTWNELTVTLTLTKEPAY